MNDNELKTFFQFDDTDLIANQMGSLTPAQLRRIGRQRQAIKLAARVIGVLLIVGDLAGAYWLWQRGLLETDLIALFLGQWAILIPFLLGVLALWASFLKDSPVILSQVEGLAQVVKVKTRHSDGVVDYHYELRCGGETFEANEHLMDSLSTDEAYRVFYFKDLTNGEVNQVLSIQRTGRRPPSP